MKTYLGDSTEIDMNRLFVLVEASHPFAAPSGPYLCPRNRGDTQSIWEGGVVLQSGTGFQKPKNNVT